MQRRKEIFCGLWRFQTTFVLWRPVMQAQAATGTWLVLTSSSARIANQQQQQQQQQRRALTYVTSSSMPYDPAHTSCRPTTEPLIDLLSPAPYMGAGCSIWSWTSHRQNKTDCIHSLEMQIGDAVLRSGADNEAGKTWLLHDFRTSRSVKQCNNNWLHSVLFCSCDFSSSLSLLLILNRKNPRKLVAIKPSKHKCRSRSL